MRLEIIAIVVTLLVCRGVKASEITDSETMVVVTASVLNKRSCPTDTCKIIGKLFARDTVGIIESADDWGRLSSEYAGEDTVWISLKYTTKKTPAIILDLYHLTPIFIFIVIPVTWIFYRRRKQSSMLKEMRNTGNKITAIVERHFLVKSCSRCKETEMKLVDVSPNARTVEYSCVHCDFSTSRAEASSPEAKEAGILYKALSGTQNLAQLVCEYLGLYKLFRAEIAQSTMWSFDVIMVSPVLDDNAGFT